MITQLVARVHGYLCLSPRDVSLAKAYVNPAPKPVSAPPAPRAADIRV